MKLMPKGLPRLLQLERAAIEGPGRAVFGTSNKQVIRRGIKVQTLRFRKGGYGVESFVALYTHHFDCAVPAPGHEKVDCL